MHLHCDYGRRRKVWQRTRRCRRGSIRRSRLENQGAGFGGAGGDGFDRFRCRANIANAHGERRRRCRLRLARVRRSTTRGFGRRCGRRPRICGMRRRMLRCGSILQFGPLRRNRHFRRLFASELKSQLTRSTDLYKAYETQIYLCKVNRPFALHKSSKYVL